MRINITSQKEQILLLEYLLSLGYECSLSGNSLIILEEELSQELFDEILSLNEENIYDLEFVQEKLNQEALQEALKIEDEKIKLERVIANASLPQTVRDSAQAKLDELNGGA